MFLSMVRKELLDNVLRLRFAVACALCLVLVIASVPTMLRGYGGDLRTYSANLTVHRGELEDLRSPEWVRHQAVDRPPTPTSVLFVGLERYMPRSLRVSRWGEPATVSGLEASPTGSLFPVVDLGFVVGIVMSLVAVVFAYDAVSGERESGTLKLVMSFPVSRASVLAAKWVGGCAGVVLPLLLCWVLICIMLLVYPALSITGLEWAVVGLLFVGSVLYLSSMYTLGLFVSAASRRSATSVITMLLLWAGLSLAIPNLAPYVASALRPVPGAAEIGAQKRKVFREEIAAAEASVAGRLTGVTDRRERWRLQRGVMEAAMAEIGRQRGRIDESFDNSMNSQVAVGRAISRLSPFACYLHAGTALCATGTDASARLSDQMSGYHATLDQWIAVTEDDPDNEWRREVPEFTYRPPSLGERLSASVVDLGLLVGYNAIFLLGAGVVFLRTELT